MAYRAVRTEASARRSRRRAVHCAAVRERCRDVLGELGDRTFERDGDASEGVDVRVRFTPLELSEVRWVNGRALSEQPLTEPALLAQFANLRADRARWGACNGCGHAPIVTQLRRAGDTPRATCGTNSFSPCVPVDNFGSGADWCRKFSPIHSRFRWSSRGKLHRCNYTMLWSNFIWFTICSASTGALSFERRA